MENWKRIYLLTVTLALIGSIAFGWQLAKIGSGNSPVSSTVVLPS